MLKLKEIRESRAMTQQEIAHKLGVSTQAYSNYELGKRDMSNRVLIGLSAILGVSADEILGISKEPREIPDFLYPVSASSAVARPIIASVRAGWNGIAETDTEPEPAVAYNIKNTEEYFFFRVKGDSMSPYICENDLALIHLQSDVENGEIAVVITEDDEGAIKKIKKHSDSIELISLNPAYPPRFLHNGEFRIWGKLVETVRKY